MDEREVVSDFEIRPVTSELWPLLAELLGDRTDGGGGAGPAGRCWCAATRIGAGYRRRPPEENRAALELLVTDGPPPGVIALSGRHAVGWCQVGPRTAAPALERAFRTRRVDDLDVWVISCLFVRKGWRRRGVATAMITGAVEFARDRGAPAIEAVPLDGAVSPSATSIGYADSYAAQGFTEIARRSPERPVLRLTF